MRVGVTLSGGFVKGIAHGGFLKALEYKGIVPSFVAGSSAGALVGALYCAGYSPDEILSLAKSYSWRKLASLSLKGALFKLDGLYQELVKLLGKVDISELKIPFGLAVVNLKTLKVEFKLRGELPALVVASCSIPPLFSPWEVDGTLYADGGLRNCLPAELTKAHGVEVNVCSNVNVPPQSFNPDSILEVSLRATLAGVLENQEKRLPYCDIIVNHYIPQSPFSFKEIEEIFDRAYRETLRVLEEEKWP
jgi:NTE family protein